MRSDGCPHAYSEQTSPCAPRPLADALGPLSDSITDHNPSDPSRARPAPQVQSPDHISAFSSFARDGSVSWSAILEPRAVYSYRNASMGSSREALKAGHIPK